MFQGKRILLIAPAFFGYEKEIKARLQQQGASVDYFDDRPSSSAWSKIAIRVMPQLKRREIRSYFTGLLERCTHGYDYVFIIKLECMPLDILLQLRERNPRAKFVYYSWDSVKNNSNIKKALHVFDSAFTFDPDDARDLPGIHLRPLFYLRDYSDIGPQERKYDLTFVGTAHSDRYRLVRQVTRAAGADTRMFIFLFMPSRWVFQLRRVLMPAFWGARASEFAFKPMTKAEVIATIGASVAVLDFQHPNQTGLTMRTVEMLGARRKIITTNATVKNYDFYRPENILVIDRANPRIDPAFFSTPYVDLPAELYSKYSIDGWLKEVLLGSPHSVPQAIGEDESMAVPA